MKTDLIGLILMVAGTALSFFNLWAIVLVFVGLALCSFYTIPQGYYGYVLVFNQNIGKAHKNGWGLKIPFISTISFVTSESCTYKQVITVQNNLNADVMISCSLTFKFAQAMAHDLKNKFKQASLKEYADLYIEPRITQAFGTICHGKTNEELKDQLNTIAADVLEELRYCKKVPDEKPDEYVEIERVNINSNLKFSKETEDNNEKLAALDREREVVKAKKEVVKAQQELAHEQRNLLIISENAQAEAVGVRAQANADKTRVEGAAENEVLAQKGEVIKEHPELIKDKAAEHLPTVYGGTINPLLTIDEFVKK